MHFRMRIAFQNAKLNCRMQNCISLMHFRNTELHFPNAELHFTNAELHFPNAELNFLRISSFLEWLNPPSSLVFLGPREQYSRSKKLQATFAKIGCTAEAGIYFPVVQSDFSPRNLRV